MSDDFGNFAMEAAPYAMAGYSAYKAYNRVEPFIKGASAALTGGQIGAQVGKIAVGQAVKTAAVATAARTAATAGASALAGGAASGAAAGATAGSVVPGLGTAIGAVVGAVAPLVISQTPLAKPIRKIPIVGGILAPNLGGKKTKHVAAREEGTQANPHLMGEAASSVVGGGNFAAQQRNEYQAGRGFRKR